jgi:hypothetical protein
MFYLSSTCDICHGPDDGIRCGATQDSESERSGVRGLVCEFLLAVDPMDGIIIDL